MRATLHALTLLTVLAGTCTSSSAFQRRHEIQSIHRPSSGGGGFIVFRGGLALTLQPGALDNGVRAYKIGSGGWREFFEVPSLVSPFGGLQNLSNLNCSEKWMAVGYPFAPSVDGSVHVQEYGANGPIGPTHILEGPLGLSGTLGSAVVMLGDELIAGAARIDGPNFTRTGAVHRYAYVNGAWSLVQDIRPDPSWVNMIRFEFGIKIHEGEGRLYISSNGDLNDDLFGRVDEYVRSSSGDFTWSQQILMPGPHAVTDKFGTSVAMSHGRLAVASALDVGSKGRVFVYVTDPATGAWTYSQTLQSSAPGGTSWGGDYFGQSIVMTETAILVADRAYSHAGDITGAVCVFRERPDGLYNSTEDYAMTMGPGSDGAHGLGYDLNVSGNTVGVSLSGAIAETGAFQFFSIDPSPTVCSGVQNRMSPPLRLDHIGGQIGTSSENAFALTGLEQGAQYLLMGALSAAPSQAGGVFEVSGLCIQGAVRIAAGIAPPYGSLSTVTNDSFLPAGASFLSSSSTVYVQAITFANGKFGGVSECIQVELQ